MKRLIMISIVFCLACFVFADAGDMSNAFYEFGNCEGGALFVIEGRVGSVLGVQSEYTTGVLGACVKVQNVSSGSRIEGSTIAPNIAFAGLTGTDVGFSFYLKASALDKFSSYPRFAVRQNPNPGPGEVNNCAAFVEWTSTAWTFDDTWRQYNFTLDTLNWDGITSGDLFTNDYYSVTDTTQTLFLDEIVLRDPTPIDASDDPYNVFASIGDCEALFWTQSHDALNTLDITTTTYQCVDIGVVGNSVKVTNPPAWARFMASTVDLPTAGLLSGTDAEFQFYYKLSGVPGYSASYPYVWLRQGVTDNFDNPYPADSGCLHSEGTSRSANFGFGGELLIHDGAWHLFKPDITGFNWAGENVDIVLSNLGCNGCPDDSYMHIDEVYLTDPTPYMSSVEDWGLYSSE